MRRALIVLVLLLGLLASGACNASSRSSRCPGGVCTIAVSGGRTVPVEFGRFERDLRVGPIEPGAVTVSARGQQARLAAAEVAEIGGLAVRVVPVSGREVGLQVRRS